MTAIPNPTSSIAAGEGALQRLRRLSSTPFIRNLGSMGVAQLAVRFSRLATTVILSRLLNPEDYGLAAIVLTVYEIVALFTRNGISAKVVQASPEEVEQVAQTAYQMTWIVCAALAVLQALVAYPVARVYDDMRLFWPIALMGLIYFATPLCNIQAAFQQREGRLGRIALAGGLQVTVDNVLTAVLAFFGLGMWAIILPKLLVAPIWIVFVRYGHAWRPSRFIFGVAGFLGWRDIARFARSFVGVELMTTFQANVDNLLVAYFLGVQALGLYYFAFNAGLGITLGLVNAFGAAVYPHLCEVRGDRDALTRRYWDAVRKLGFMVVPLVLAQTFLAPIYVPLVFGAKWTPAIPVLMIICLSALARPFATTCSQLLKAVGRPDIELRWQTVLSLVLTAALIAGAQFGVVAVAAAVFIVQTAGLAAYFVRAPRGFLSHSREPVAVSLEALEMEGAEVRFEIVTEESEFLALREEWNDLWSRAEEPRVSQGFDWCLAGWKTTGLPRAREIALVTARSEGRLVLVWPLTTRRAYLWKLAGAMGAESTEYDPLLVDPALGSERLARAAHEFVRRSHIADVLTVPFVNEASPRSQVIAQSTAARETHGLPAPSLSWSGFASWDAYMASRSSKLRTGYNRRLRNFKALGDVKIAFLEDASSRIAAIDWTLRMKADWLARKNIGNDFIREPEYRAFLIELARSTSRMAVMTMTLDGRIVACKIGTVDNARFEGFITVYDPQFEDYSPGVLILVDCLRWCFAKGLTYDFRIGDEAYKLNWANEALQKTTHEIALQRWGEAYFQARRHLAKIERLVNRAREAVPKSLRSRLKASVTFRRPNKPALENQHA